MSSGDPHETRSWKISLSTLLLMMAVVALAIGWYAESRRSRQMRQELLKVRQRLQLLETSAYYDETSPISFRIEESVE